MQIMEPAAEHPWLVDWLWGPVYRSHLRPFLALAGSASGGATITRYPFTAGQSSAGYSDLLLMEDLCHLE